MYHDKSFKLVNASYLIVISIVDVLIKFVIIKKKSPTFYT